MYLCANPLRNIKDLCVVFLPPSPVIRFFNTEPDPQKTAQNLEIIIISQAKLQREHFRLLNLCSSFIKPSFGSPPFASPYKRATKEKLRKTNVFSQGEFRAPSSQAHVFSNIHSCVSFSPCSVRSFLKGSKCQ